MSISIGMVGLGDFGGEFIKLFKEHPSVDRIALCDLNTHLLKYYSRKFEISETYHSLREILKTDIEALVIITQPEFHASQAIKTLKAGKHVYSAVPVASSLEECDELVRTVERTGLIYMMGETSYFRSETVFCRKRAKEGSFGEFVYCEGEYMHDLIFRMWGQRINQYRYGIEWEKHTHLSIPFMYPTHSIAFPVSITGAHMIEVSAMGYTYPNEDWLQRYLYPNKNQLSKKDKESEFCNEVALFRMSNGAIARICEFRKIGHQTAERFRIFGTKGSFEWDVSGSRWCHIDNWEPVNVENYRDPLPKPLASDLGGHGGSHAYLAHEFVDSLVHNRQPGINVWEAARYFAPGVVAHQSSLKDGEPLKVPDWGDAPER